MRCRLEEEVANKKGYKGIDTQWHEFKQYKIQRQKEQNQSIHELKKMGLKKNKKIEAINLLQDKVDSIKSDLKIKLSELFKEKKIKL